MLLLEVSLTTTSMIGLEIMEFFFSEVIQYIISTAFSPINITTTWNGLPYDVVNSLTLNTFNNHLDAHMGRQSPTCASRRTVNPD